MGLLNEAVGYHGVGYSEEARYVGAAYVIAGMTVFFRVIEAALVDIRLNRHKFP